MSASAAPVVAAASAGAVHARPCCPAAPAAVAVASHSIAWSASCMEIQSLRSSARSPAAWPAAPKPPGPACAAGGSAPLLSAGSCAEARQQGLPSPHYVPLCCRNNKRIACLPCLQAPARRLCHMHCTASCIRNLVSCTRPAHLLTVPIVKVQQWQQRRQRTAVRLALCRAMQLTGQLCKGGQLQVHTQRCRCHRLGSRSRSRAARFERGGGGGCGSRRDHWSPCGRRQSRRSGLRRCHC